LDRAIVRLFHRHATALLRISLGIVFVRFGALKFIPDWSPAEELVGRTSSALTLGALSPTIGVLGVATWECLVELGLLFERALRITLLLLLAQMLGTLAPLALFPAETLIVVPIRPTLEGQYILKNFVLIASALVIGSTLRDAKRNRPAEPAS
jgi:uncharacterized membrane protein YkgB